MFGRSSASSFEQILPQIRQRTLATTESLMLCEATLAAGSHVPPHRHEHEQITFIVEGRVRTRIGDETAELAAGDVYAIPGGTEHEVHALTEARVVDVFTPHRPEYALARYVASG